MTDRVQRLFEALPNPGSIEDLGVLIDQVREVFEVDNVNYLALSLGMTYSLSSCRDDRGQFKGRVGNWWRRAGSLGAFTYDPEWITRYDSEGYERIDPVVEGALQSFIPLDWKQLDWSTAKRRQLLREGVEFGLGNQGYTVPLRGPDGQFALFVINHNCPDHVWDSFKKECANDILIISHFFHQKVLEIEKVFGEMPKAKLSGREADVLKHIATGKNRAQVAHDLKISENTLRVYLDSARHKLGALNITHAVAIGVNRGILNI